MNLYPFLISIFQRSQFFALHTYVLSCDISKHQSGFVKSFLYVSIRIESRDLNEHNIGWFTSRELSRMIQKYDYLLICRVSEGYESKFTLTMPLTIAFTLCYILSVYVDVKQQTSFLQYLMKKMLYSTIQVMFYVYRYISKDKQSENGPSYFSSYWICFVLLGIMNTGFDWKKGSNSPIFMVLLVSDNLRLIGPMVSEQTAETDGQTDTDDPYP